MKLKRTLSLLLASALAVGALAGCGGGNDASSQPADTSSAAATSDADKTIVIGASPAPHMEILEAMSDEFAKEGYTLEIKEFTDYVQPNKALADGEIDANFFQHKPFLDNFNKENNTDLVPVAFVHYEPMAIFPGKTKTLDELPDGAKIAVPNDASNEARALLLLADNGLITMKEGTGIKATVRDIADNPKNLEIVEMEAAQIPRALQDVDLAVINGNFAIASEIPFDTNLAAEGADSIAARVYANVVAMRAEDAESDVAKVINKVLTSDACAKFIADKYNGTVIAVDEEKVKSHFDAARKGHTEAPENAEESSEASSEAA